jgi:hypothetical protein
MDMSESEIVIATEQYRARITALLTPEEIAQYDSYERRIQAAVVAGNSDPIEITPAEQAVLNKIAADERAAALHKQLMVLLRIESLPQ